MLGVGGGIYYGEVDNGNGGGVEGSGGEEVSQYAGEFQKVHSVLVDGGESYGASAVTFDLHEELIWIGNQGGHVTSYYGANMEKYTSFQVINNQEIRQILTFDDIILILSQSQLRGQIRRGLPVFTHVSENLIDMQCMLQTSPSSVLLGGHQESLVEFDLPQNMEIRTVQVGESGCAILRGHSHNRICAGQATGQIHLLDLRSYREEQTIEAHSGSLSDFDVHGNLLVSCGFSSRHGALNVDRFLKVCDLRVMRALAPIQVSIDPFLLRFLPSFSSRICAISPGGQMEILETQALSTSNIMIYQVTENASMCLGFDVSSSCHHMAFGDSEGTLSLFSSNPEAMFNPFSRDTEFPDPVEQFPPMNIMDEAACLAAIPMPLLNNPLSSDWPAYLITPAYRRHPEIDPNILNSMKMVGTIGYAPNPGGFRRNQMSYNKEQKSGNNIMQQPMSPGRLSYHSSPNRNIMGARQFIPNNPQVGGGFLQHSPSHGPPRGHPASFPPSAVKRYSQQGNKYHVPKRYARIEWKKNTFELGDMEPFNKTRFSGLEAITVNSYCNSMLQVLFHLEYLRGFLISHLCSKEACLSCELGFLFYMMDQSKTLPCAGSNFLRAFRVVPEASALGLIRQESQAKQRSAHFRLIQSWNRFILHQIETETGIGKGKPLKELKEEDAITKLFAMRQENMNRCTRCGREAKKESTVLLSNLLYSLDATGNGKRCNFVEVLQRSLCPEQTTPAWCDQCEKYQPTFQSRAPKALPPILSLNTCLDNAHDFMTWKTYLESLLPEKSPRSEQPPAPPIMISPTNPYANQYSSINMKSCRYGKNCVRPDCKFFHEGRTPIPGGGENVRITEFEINPELQVKWLPSKIRVNISEKGKVNVVDLDASVGASPLPSNVDMNSTADYELISVVVFVKDAENEDKNNLVAIVKVDSPYFERSTQTNKPGWYLFNDFSVKEILASEASSFNPKWKIPSVIYYQKVSLPESLKTFPIFKTVTGEVFKTPAPEPKNKEVKNKKLTYKPLTVDEIPQKGELVAMDAEFVTLGQEETELRSDGKLAMIKPQQLSLARVTCLRGQGAQEGTPFLDDYISTQEVVVDYLTKFSGIQPGDLDVNFSSKHVTGLKSVYLKLRFLIDSGVKFVGHGLSNDFRVINLVVPPDQVVDTVNLFYLPNQRMVSLRFLAWHFLGMIIQSETHDSREDAHAALALYRKYEELAASGGLEKALEDLYEMGSKLQWKVNGSDK